MHLYSCMVNRHETCIVQNIHLYKDRAYHSYGSDNHETWENAPQLYSPSMEYSYAWTKSAARGSFCNAPIDKITIAHSLLEW